MAILLVEGRPGRSGLSGQTTMRVPGCRRAASLATTGSAQDLVDVAPAPRLVRLEAAHHRVTGVREVAVRVPLRRAVAAADVAAGQAQPQVHPGRALGQAPLAALRRAGPDGDRCLAQVLAVAAGPLAGQSLVHPHLLQLAAV